MPFYKIGFSFKQLLHYKKQGIRLGVGVTVTLVVLLSINLGISIHQQKIFSQVVDSTALDLTLITNKPLETSGLFSILRDNHTIPITNIIGIDNIGPSVVIGSYTWLSGNATNFNDSKKLNPISIPAIYTISNNDFDDLIDRGIITGFSFNYNLTNNSVLIDNYTADIFNVNIGDTINILNQIENRSLIDHTFLNYSLPVQIGGIVEINRSSPSFQEFIDFTQDLDPEESISENIPFLNPFILVDFKFYSELLALLTGGSLEQKQGYETFFLFIDRSTTLRSYDIAGTMVRLNALEQRIAVILMQEHPDMNFGIQTRLVDLLQKNQSDLDFLRLLLMFASLPTCLISLYFSIIASHLTIKERQRDIGILKSRGASSRQIQFLYIFEGMMTGVLSGLCAIPCTILLTSVLFRIHLLELMTILFPFQNPLVYMFIICIGSLLGGAILGVIVNWQAARDVILLEILPSLRKTPLETENLPIQEKKKLSKWPVLILSLILMAFFGFIGLHWLPTNFFQPLLYLLFIFTGLGAVIAPLLPILLPWALIKILSEKVSFLAGLMQYIVQPVLKDAKILVHQSFLHSIRIGKQLALITSLVLSFTILPLFLSQNLHTFAIDTIETEVGADLTLEGFLDKMNQTSEKTIRTNLPTDAIITSAFYVEGIFHYYEPNEGITGVYSWMVGINTSSYNDVAALRFFHASTSSSAAALAEDITSLGEHEVIIDKYVADRCGYQVGDLMFYDMNVKNKTDGEHLRISYNFTITAIKRLLPGVDGPEAGSSHDIAAVIVNLDLILPLIEKFSFHGGSWAPRFKYLIKLPSNADPNVLSSTFYTIFGTDIYVRNLAQEISETKAALSSLDLVIQALEGEAALVGVLLIFCVTIFVSLTLRDREQEFGMYRSRGIQDHQLFILIFAQILSLSVAGVVLGALAGWISGLLLNNLTLYYFNPTGIPIPSEFPILGFFLIVGVLLAFILVTIYGYHRLRQKPIINQIRIVNR
ncbi:MAG: ABC transporter permease [Promethearchaeota archaeon]